MGLPDDAFVVLVVGRNPPPPSVEAGRKSHRAAIKAFARFALELREVCGRASPPAACAGRGQAHLHLHCALEGGTDIPALLRESGLRLGADVTNTREQMPPEQLRALYGAADVLLQLSRAEGFGLPIVEAQACGTPVVANSATAMAENVLLGEVLPLAGKPTGGRADRPGSWTPPDIQAAATALMQAWRSPPTTPQRNLARAALLANLAPSAIGRSIHQSLLDATSPVSRPAATLGDEAEACQAPPSSGDATPDGASVELLSSSGDDGSRPICAGDFSAFMERCAPASPAASADDAACASMEDRCRSCLRQGWRQLGATQPQRLPQREHLDAVHRLVSTKYGSPMLYSVFDLRVGRSLEVSGEWLPAEVAVYEVLLESSSGGVAVEVGAHIGALTVPLGLLVGPRGRIIALEADRVNAQLLSANVALAQLLHVEVLQATVGATAGTADVEDDVASRISFGTPSSRQARRRISRLTIDKLTSRLPRLDLLKISAIAEPPSSALLGAKQALGRFRPWLLVEVSPSHGPEAVEQIAAELGYECGRCDMPVSSGSAPAAQADAMVRDVLCGHSAQSGARAALRRGLAACAAAATDGTSADSVPLGGRSPSPRRAKKECVRVDVVWST